MIDALPRVATYPGASVVSAFRRIGERGAADVLVVACPWCDDEHAHAAGAAFGDGDGHQMGPCHGPLQYVGYILREVRRPVTPALRARAAIAARPRPRPHRHPARPAVPPTLRARVMERDGFRCRRCGATPDEGALLVADHIVPVALGGATTVENMQTLCTPCNQGKGARRPHAHDLRPFTESIP